MKWMAGGALALGALAAGAGTAHAGIESVHVGVIAHNVRVIDGKNANKEDGPIIEAQVNFSAPGFLRWAGAPQPYILLAPNVSGDTSFGGIGLEWRVPLGGAWSLEPSLGYVLHDGETTNPFPNGTPEAAAFAEEHVQYGSEDLWRVSLGLSRELTERMSGQLFFTHYSHGQILGSGRNQGVDQAGVRIGFRL